MKLVALLLVAVHSLIVAVHGAAHQKLSVDLSGWQSAFVFIVIMAAPIAAAALIMRFERTGALLLTVSMTGAFVFGVYFHFIAESPDHVSQVAAANRNAWAGAFSWSAAALAMTASMFGLSGSCTMTACSPTGISSCCFDFALIIKPSSDRADAASVAPREPCVPLPPALPSPCPCKLP